MFNDDDSVTVHAVDGSVFTLGDETMKLLDETDVVPIGPEYGATIQ